jgi:hypothetical protein
MTIKNYIVHSKKKGGDGRLNQKYKILIRKDLIYSNLICSSSWKAERAEGKLEKQDLKFMDIFFLNYYHFK